MHRILVVGASGRTGTQVVVEGLRRGHAITAFGRDPARLAHLPAAARRATGDGLAAASVAAATPGHDAVVVAVGDARTFVSAPVTANVVAAMQAAGVRRLLLLSAYGIGDSGHGLQGVIFRTALKKLNADKMLAELLLDRSGLDWTALRPSTLSTKPATGRLRAATGARINGFRTLPRADLAAFMLDELDRNAFVRQRPVLWRG